MIDVTDLTKRYGDVRAVDGLTFRVEPGHVTGFLGPNGAGKTTTLRILLGTARATSGAALVGGRRYADLPHPARTVGALLDPAAGYPHRAVRTHLRCLARAAGVPAARVGEVLERVGLSDVAARHVGALSLGMRQRLGLATALLGDPEVLVLDEPVNGLDVDGIRWLRDLLRDLAAQGRTVLVSSHLMSEVERVADRLVVVTGGRLLACTSPAELAGRVEQGVLVRSPRHAELAAALVTAGARVEPGAEDDVLVVHDITATAVGDLAAAGGFPVWQISQRRACLEDAYLALVDGGLPAGATASWSQDAA